MSGGGETKVKGNRWNRALIYAEAVFRVQVKDMLLVVVLKSHCPLSFLYFKPHGLLCSKELKEIMSDLHSSVTSTELLPSIT